MKRTTGQKIAAFLHSRGWSMTHAGKLAGVTAQCVWRMVNDKYSPSVRTLERYAEAWGCRLELGFKEKSDGKD